MLFFIHVERHYIAYALFLRRITDIFFKTFFWVSSYLKAAFFSNYVTILYKNIAFILFVIEDSVNIVGILSRPS